MNILNIFLEPTHDIELVNFIILLSMTAVGIGETIYLIKKRLAIEPPICVIGYECRKVLESKYSTVLGIHNDVLGLAFYIAVTLLVLLLGFGLGPHGLWDLLLEVTILGGTVTSAILLYLQWKVIKAWCFWCVISAATVFAMFAVMILGNLV